MQRPRLGGKPVHAEGMHHIISKEQPNMAIRYYMWLNNEVPNTIEFVMPMKANLFRQMMNDDPYFKDAAESYKEIYEETDGKTVLTKSVLSVQIRTDLIIFIPDYGASIAYGPSVSEAELNELTEKIRKVSLLSAPAIQREKSFSMVVHEEYGGFQLHDFSLRNEEADLERNYNDDLPDIHTRLVSILSEKESSGLILLHGAPGTGKTSYLRHLIRKVDANFIYLPSNVVHNLGEPSFIPFISRLKGAVIILEDCEDLLRPRTSDVNSEISMLLNLADGLLGDALRFKIICTFNANIHEIDSAMVRKGRLLCRYEFEKLSLEKTNALLKEKGHDVVSDVPLTLADIYNYNLPDNQMSKNKKIGF